MQGSYNSTAQHLKDTTNYFDIRLQIKPIWKIKKNGYWFYVEQAVASSIDKPYRQRVYHLIENSDGSFSSFIFTFNEPLRYTHKPKLLEKTLTVDSLQERKGCEVKLKIDEKGNYIGSTNGKSCPSDRKGASYAISEVIIVPMNYIVGIEDLMTTTNKSGELQKVHTSLLNRSLDVLCSIILE